MTEKLTVHGLDDDESRILNDNWARLDARRRRNLSRADLYDGKQFMGFVKSGVVPPQYYQLGIALGWAGKAIDSLVRRCRIEAMVWPDGDLASIGGPEIVRDNALLSELRQGLTDSALHGPAYIITTQGMPGEPRSLVHVKDVTTATGTLNPRTRRLDDALSVTDWDEHGKPSGLVLYLPDLTVSAERVAGRWQVERSEHSWGVPVEPLIYRPRPSKRYGQPRLTRPMIGLQMQAIRELVRLEGHMDVYSYPELWLLGGDLSVFKNADGSQQSMWQVMLGRIKGIADDTDTNKPDGLQRAEVKQFPAASPEPHLATLDMLSRAFAREASLPDSAVALTGTANPTSADAYDAAQYELIAEAEGAMADWEAPITRATARAIAILNQSAVDPRWLTIAPQWLGAKFESKAAKADAGAKAIGAIPWLAETRVGLEMLGLSEQQINLAMAEKRRASGRAVIEALGARNGVSG